MSPKRLAIVVGAAVLVLAAGGILAWQLAARARVIATLTFVHPMVGEADARALSQVLAEFTSLYPRIVIRSVAKDPLALRGASLVESLREGADAAAATGPVPEGAKVWASPPSPWSGTLWVLAARRDVLDGLPGLAEPVAALRAGRLSPLGFEELLSSVKAARLVPITLGNSHGWPFLIWLQHWAAATVGPDAVSSLPSGKAVADKAYLGRLAPAYADLARWKADGWFDSESWPKGWAQGLQPLSDGRAVFALLAAPMLTALSEDARQSLEFLPFPGSRGTQPWSIGAVYLIGVTSGTRWPEQSGLLVRYLTSPGVTQVLSRRLGRPFFAWDAGTGQSPLVIPDWYGAINSPQLAVLEDAFGKP